MFLGTGQTSGYLDQVQIKKIVYESLRSLHLENKRVLFIIPDTTRTLPMPALFDLFREMLDNVAKKHDYLVALGTHPPLNDRKLSKLFGKNVDNGCIGSTRIFNHEWQNQNTFAHVGVIASDEIHNLSGGLLSTDVPVAINKIIFDYDQVIVCGPVFPHEVVGFSGGTKYLIPGIAGEDIINLTHWLGALITSSKVIGHEVTPVKAVIDRAAEFVQVPIQCYSFVVTSDGVAGIYFGDIKDAWQAAVKLSATRHIIYKSKSYRRVLSIMPDLYDDLWTAAKGMYKVDPIIEDGGEVVIYAPRIREVSITHGKMIDEIGYHCRDFFTLQWEKYKDYPGGVLAHSTHLRGQGKYDPMTGIESPRIKVVLATGIPPERCKRINLDYISPGEIRIQDWQNRESEGILIVPNAGESLYRLMVENDLKNR